MVLRSVSFQLRLISGARALLLPSAWNEPLSRLLIESMALGTPVVTSDQPALAEVVADAGLVRPLESDAWSDVLTEVGRRRAELVAAGTQRVRHFTTDSSGRALAAAYDRAMGES